MPSLNILDLNLQYEFERAARTDNTALNELMLARNGLMKEIIETFGEDMGDVKLDRKYVTRFDYEKDPTKPAQLPEKNNDDLILGILRFANALGLDNFGGDGKWARAVIEMAGWYVKNVHAYSQPTLTFCPLVNRNVRWDCSGFTTACLWLYGALQDVMWPPTSSTFPPPSPTAMSTWATAWSSWVRSCSAPSTAPPPAASALCWPTLCWAT